MTVDRAYRNLERPSSKDRRTGRHDRSSKLKSQRMSLVARVVWIALVLAAAPSCAPPTIPGLPREGGPIELFDGRVIPAMPELLGKRAQYELRLEWLAEKHELLLALMRSHRIEMWIVVSEEFHTDPVMQYVVPPLHYTRRRDVIVFVDAGPDGLKKYSDYWRPTEDYARFFEPLPAARNARGIQDTPTGLKALWEQYQPETIALNMGGARGHDSGLTYDTYQFLADALGSGSESRFVSAAALIEDYFDKRLPGELEPYRSLVLATDVIAQRALSNEVITPGVTQASDIKWFFEETIAELGVGGVPWFEIHVAVQRYDPDNDAMIPYVHPAPDSLVFQPGDIIHLDCGFDYLGFASDWQKVAYILRKGEETVPAGLRVALANANVVHEAFASEPRPGMTGWDATLAIANKLEGVDFLPSLYSHPIGYHGHALGPSINARNMDLSTPPDRDSVLRPGSYRSVEFSATTAVPEYGGGTVTIPMEDDAYLTTDGYIYFRPYQTEWYVIR
ncbi:MAG: M24 family metallopeptidase [Acidobacteria bacterium]|nr:MAG: M24 family metallopeptidase [Acidobacteriota bacterium]